MMPRRARSTASFSSYLRQCSVTRNRNRIHPEGDNAILPRQRSQVRPARRIPNNRSNGYLLNIGVRLAEPRQSESVFPGKNRVLPTGLVADRAGVRADPLALATTSFEDRAALSRR